MISYVISDNTDTLVGMRLAGITGIEVGDKKSAEEEFDRCIHDKNIGILILTEEVFAMMQDKVMQEKLKRKFPLIVEIPGRDGMKRDPNYITDYINRSIGIKI